MKYEKLKKLVYNYKTKYEQGFIKQEMIDICNKLKVDQDMFSGALGINTCMVINDEVITYHWDILKALTICINNTKYLDFD